MKPWMLCMASFLLCLCANPTPAEDGELRPGLDASQPPGSVRFMVTFTRGVNSKNAILGQAVEASLQDDVRLDGKTFAPAGSAIFGHIERLRSARLSKSLISSRRKHSSLMVIFDRIVTPDKKEINIDAQACRQFSLFNNGHVLREIVIDRNGEIVKTGDTTMIKDMEWGIAFPRSWVALRERSQIDIRPGDQITVQAKEPDAMLVSGKVLTQGAGKSGTDRNR